MLAALHNGAAAYVLKEASSTDIIRAVREIAAGRRGSRYQQLAFEDLRRHAEQLGLHIARFDQGMRAHISLILISTSSRRTRKLLYCLQRAGRDSRCTL